MSTSREITAFSKRKWAMIVSLVSLFCLSQVVYAQTFYQPATGHNGVVSNVDSAISLAWFNNELIVAYQNTSGTLSIVKSSDGVTFSTAPSNISNVPMSSAPDITVFNNKLYVAYLGSVENELMYTTSSDGSTFSAPVAMKVATSNGPIQSNTAPALAVFDGTLFVAFVQTGLGYPYYSTSTDGVTFTGPADLGEQLSELPPSLAVYNNTLYAAYQSDSTKELVTDTYNGSTFVGETSYPGILIGSRPTLTSNPNYGLVVAFRSANSSNVLFTTTGTSASTLTSPASGYFPNIQFLNGPGLITDPNNNGLIVAVQSNDSHHILFTSNTFSE